MRWSQAERPLQDTRGGRFRLVLDVWRVIETVLVNPHVVERALGVPAPPLERRILGTAVAIAVARIVLSGSGLQDCNI